MRVKLVIRKTMDGAKVRIVITARIWIPLLTFSRSFPACGPTLIRNAGVVKEVPADVC